MATTDNMNSIYSFLKSKGLTDAATAGVMGNLQQESNFNPAIKNSIGAFGLAQWLGARKTQLLKKNKPTSLTTQEDFLWQELASGSQGVNVKQLNTMSASDAAAYISNKFERPGNDGSLPTRQANATAIYNEIQNGKLTASGSNASSTQDTTGLTDTSFGIPTVSSIGKMVMQAIGMLVGAGIIFMGIYIAVNPFSDISSAVASLSQKSKG